MIATRSRQSRRRGQRPGPAAEIQRLESRELLSAFNLAPLATVSGDSPFAGSPAEANDPPGTVNIEFEPYVAVDPTDSSHLVGVWIQDFNRGIVAGVSFNGGNTWQSVAIPGITLVSGGTWPHVFDPWVSIAPDGDVYVTSVGTNAKSEQKAILVNKSTDGGLTWSAPTTLAQGKSNSDGHDKVSITADPTNSQFVYATWTRFSGSNQTAMFSRSTDGGQTWEPARKIFDPGSNNGASWLQIVVLPDGTLVNVFSQQIRKNSNHGGASHYDVELALIRSSDHGQTWQFADAPIPVADIVLLDDTLTSQNVPTPDGGLAVRAPSWGFDVAVDPANGNLYAVWQDVRFSNSQYNSIAFAMSSDGGLSWSAPIKINQTPDDIPAGNRQAFLPSVAVNEDGVVAVTYYDFRNNTPAPGLPTDIWMVHAHPADGLTNPASWSSENRLTPASFDLQVPAPSPDGYFVGDYQGLVAMGSRFGAFWAMVPGATPSLEDQSSIFFRGTLPAAPLALLSPGSPAEPAPVYLFETNAVVAPALNFEPILVPAVRSFVPADDGRLESSSLDETADPSIVLDSAADGVDDEKPAALFAEFDGSLADALLAV
jgi:BNR/Asp-box repeat